MVAAAEPLVACNCPKGTVEVRTKSSDGFQTAHVPSTCSFIAKLKDKGFNTVNLVPLSLNLNDAWNGPNE
jgi:hypothetical protein